MQHAEPLRRAGHRDVAVHRALDPVTPRLRPHQDDAVAIERAAGGVVVVALPVKHSAVSRIDISTPSAPDTSVSVPDNQSPFLVSDSSYQSDEGVLERARMYV